MGNICENRLIATGSKQQTEMLAALIKKSFETENFEEDYIDSEDFYQLELYFDTSWRFPKDHFREITSSLPDIEGLHIRVASDEPATNYLEQSIFEDGIWNFESPQTTIKIHHIAKDVVCATGAYITPFSYTNKEGKTIFSWMVTGFSESVYRDGVEIDVVDSAYTLEGLTPPEAELRDAEYIVKSLQSHGAQSSELGMYKIIMPDEKVSIYVANLRNQSGLGNVEKIQSTLDNFLLNSPNFSQTTREILVDAFGADREDIFTSDGYALIIGQHINNVWVISECNDKESGAIKSNQ